MTEAQDKRLEELQRKHLDEIDLSADLTKDPNEVSTSGSDLEEKIKKTRPVLVTVVVLIAALLLLNYAVFRPLSRTILHNSEVHLESVTQDNVRALPVSVIQTRFPAILFRQLGVFGGRGNPIPLHQNRALRFAKIYLNYLFSWILTGNDTG